MDENDVWLQNDLFRMVEDFALELWCDGILALSSIWADNLQMRRRTKGTWIDYSKYAKNNGYEEYSSDKNWMIKSLFSWSQQTYPNIWKNMYAIGGERLNLLPDQPDIAYDANQIIKEIKKNYPKITIAANVHENLALFSLWNFNAIYQLIGVESIEEIKDIEVRDVPFSKDFSIEFRLKSWTTWTYIIHKQNSWYSLTIKSSSPKKNFTKQELLSLKFRAFHAGIEKVKLDIVAWVDAIENMITLWWTLSDLSKRQFMVYFKEKYNSISKDYNYEKNQSLFSNVFVDIQVKEELESYINTLEHNDVPLQTMYKNPILRTFWEKHFQDMPLRLEIEY